MGKAISMNGVVTALTILLKKYRISMICVGISFIRQLLAKTYQLMIAAASFMFSHLTPNQLQGTLKELR